MAKKVAINHVSNVGSEGLTLHLTDKTSLKGGTLKTDSFWVSWDKIGGLLFDNYATGDVTAMDKVRNSTKEEE